MMNGGATVDGEALLRAAFVSRPNRFLVEAELADGSVVAAHLPNTGRLTHLTEPGRPLILRRADGPGRKTRFTVTRAWDGCWVALEAAKAADLVARWLEAGNPLSGFGKATRLDREVAVGSHRLDLRVHQGGGAPIWLEVKSSGRVVDGTALLSQTPSTRGSDHLAVLSAAAQSGSPAAVAFVVQRPDAERLLVGGDADPGWIEAVRGAAESGVAVLAFGCAVSPAEVELSGPLPVDWNSP